MNNYNNVSELANYVTQLADDWGVGIYFVVGGVALQSLAVVILTLGIIWEAVNGLEP